MINEEKLATLVHEIKSNRLLAKKLDILVDEQSIPSTSDAKRTSRSPIRVKKILKTATGKVIVVKDDSVATGSPKLNAHVRRLLMLVPVFSL